MHTNVTRFALATLIKAEDDDEEEEVDYLTIQLPFFDDKRCRRRQHTRKNKIVNSKKIRAPIPIDE